MNVCFSCKNEKNESEFKKGNAIPARLSYMHNKNKNKNESQIDECEPFMNEINNYHLLQYKLLRISLDGSSYGKTLESMNWVKYS